MSDKGRSLDDVRAACKALTDEQQAAIGQKLIDVLGLKLNRGGRVNTSWGDKTPLGFYLTVKRIMDEGVAAEGQSDDAGN